VYRNGTIGNAKDHLENTALKLDARLKAIGGHAYVSVNKALVTRPAPPSPHAAVHQHPLQGDERMGNHEGCLEQMDRLFRTKALHRQAVPVDEKGRIRMDDWELREDVQKEVDGLWQTVTTENGNGQSDILGYRSDFHRLYGFGIAGVDYAADVPESAI